MTLHRENHDVIFECDGCDETLAIEKGGDDWDSTRETFKEEDWRAEKVSDEWLHFCPTCRRKSRL